MKARRQKNPYGVRRKAKNKALKSTKSSVPQLIPAKHKKIKDTEKPEEKKVELLKKLPLKNWPSLMMKSPKEIRTSLVNVKKWSSQMRGTMAQMETTLDTLSNLLGMYERWTAKQANKSMQKADKTGNDKKVPLSLIKTFNNIDFRQIINVLNSPLVQAFMELNSGDTEEEERKEG